LPEILTSAREENVDTGHSIIDQFESVREATVREENVDTGHIIIDQFESVREATVKVLNHILFCISMLASVKS
jgi:hypothetical protein